MEDKYPKAFKEVHMILKRTSKQELNKIPKTFIDFIEKNMDMEYEPRIDFSDDFENSVLEETLAILALIYRDYLISKEERQQLIENEKTQLEELKESYNIDNLFKKKNQEYEESNKNIEQQLMVITEEKWYKKILNKIINLFKNKN